MAYRALQSNVLKICSSSLADAFQTSLKNIVPTYQIYTNTEYLPFTPGNFRCFIDFSLYGSIFSSLADKPDAPFIYSTYIVKQECTKNMTTQAFLKQPSIASCLNLVIKLYRKNQP